LTIHADRGASMASKPVAFLLADLGVTKSHSRPHCSNDNPYSEAQFKTLKYRPTFPDRFGRKPPIPPTLPTTSWINQPKEEPLDTANP
jgi:transposase InsO family protein